VYQTDIQTVEPCVDIIESSVYTGFQTVDPRFDAVESCVRGAVVNSVYEDSDQHSEGRDADGEI